MAYNRYRQASFGASKAGLGTVGYQLYNGDGSPNGGRVTSGVAERGTGTGIYGAVVTHPSGFVGEIRWDTGGGAPVYAAEAINPGSDEYEDAATSSISGGGGGAITPGDAQQLRYRLGLDGAATQPSSAVPHLVAGDVAGAVPVDHNSGGPGNLAFVDPLHPYGLGSVRAFLTADFAAGGRDASYEKGASLTNADGTWRTPMLLQPGDYTLLWVKDGSPTARRARYVV